MSNLLKSLKSLHEPLGELLAALADERAALTANNLPQLARAVEDKRTLLQSIHQQNLALNPATVLDRINQAPAAERPELLEQHQILQRLARQTRESNRVNGKIVSRSQQSLLELMRLTLGNQVDGIYGEHGETKSLMAGGPVAEA